MANNATQLAKLLSTSEVLTASQVSELISAEQTRAQAKETALSTALGMDGFSLTTDTSFVSGKTYYTKDADGGYTAATVSAGDDITAETYYEKHTVADRLAALENAAVGDIANLTSEVNSLKTSMQTLMTGLAAFASIDDLPDVYKMNEVKAAVSAMLTALKALHQD